MNLYKLSQDINNTWDTYDSCVVCAKTKDDAKLIHPDGSDFFDEIEPLYGKYYGTWVQRKDIDKIEVELIGKASKQIKRGVIVSSYNAG